MERPWVFNPRETSPTKRLLCKRGKEHLRPSSKKIVSLRGKEKRMKERKTKIDGERKRRCGRTTEDTLAFYFQNRLANGRD